MKVSLIIPTYKRDEPLVETIKCALNQNFSDYEIIVVDQTEKHSPETTQFLNEQKEKLTCIYSDTPSLTKARNIGVHASRGEVIVMVDDDTTFDQNFLSHHWDAHQSGHDVVSGRVEEGKALIASQPVWVNNWFVFSGSENCKTSGPTNKMAGCNGSFKRKVFDSIGGFDPNFYGTAICEDTDFGYRAHKNGFDVYFHAPAELIHHKAETGGVQNRDKNLKLNPSYYYCLLYFIKKNLPFYALYYMRIRLYIRVIKASFRMLNNVQRDLKE